MELGSNFELDISKISYCRDSVKQYLKDLYPIYVDSGRSAIKLLASQIKKGKILLPSYICKSVVDSFADKFEIDYYLINEKLQIDIQSLTQKLNQDVAIVYVMHYFGKTQNKDALELILRKKEEKEYLIIEDTTHSFLSGKQTIGDYQICSLRKWFAIPDGGVIYSQNAIETDSIRKANPSAGMVCEAMLLKYLFIHNKVDCNSVYRKIFVDNEEQLDKQKEIYDISDLSDILLEYTSLKAITETRSENWNFLYNTIKNNLIYPVYQEKAADFVPFAYPVFVEDRDRFRKYLIDHKIYCAVHWPIEIEEQKHYGKTQFMSEHLLSLPIDQRYTLEEMEYMTNIINQYN